MRTDFLDFPTAWAIQDEVGTSLEHDSLCSSVPSLERPTSGPHFLCDCGAVQREWGRRVIDEVTVVPPTLTRDPLNHPPPSASGRTP